MFDVGGGEFLLIIIAIVVLFGPKKIPEMMRSVGKGISYLRRAQSEFERNMHGIKSEVDAVVDPIKSVTSRAARAGKADSNRPATTAEQKTAPNSNQKLPDEPPQTIDTRSLRPNQPELAELAPQPPAPDENTTADESTSDRAHMSSAEKHPAAETEDIPMQDETANGTTPRPAAGIVDRHATDLNKQDAASQSNGTSGTAANKEITKERRKSDKST